MATIVPQPAHEHCTPRRESADERRAAMLADWHAGMRQVDIAEKYGISQGYVSRLIGSSPRTRAGLAQAAEPSASEYRARCLLALALVNHRATDTGLSVVDTEHVRMALLGKWDEVAA